MLYINSGIGVLVKFQLEKKNLSHILTYDPLFFTSAFVEFMKINKHNLPLED